MLDEVEAQGQADATDEICLSSTRTTRDDQQSNSSINRGSWTEVGDEKENNEVEVTCVDGKGGEVMILLHFFRTSRPSDALKYFFKQVQVRVRLQKEANAVKEAANGL